jgi:ribosomal protein S18 acetylase RimI-like enzyme
MPAPALKSVRYRNPSGVGGSVMHVLIEDAIYAKKAITLAVVKINPARRLYDRLGFRVTHEDQHKVYMRREQDQMLT